MRRGLLLVFLLVLSAGLLLAKDFWKEKPYTEWTVEEAWRVMTDSPWARLVRITALLPGGPAGAPSPTGNEGTGAVGAGGGGLSGPSGTGGGPSGATTGGSGYEGPASETVYSIWWSSAKTFRQAFARLQQLRGVANADQAKQYVETRPADFVIVLRGENMNAFQKVTEDTLRSVTYLRPKRLKRKVGPSRVDIQRVGDTQRIGAILFTFPRTVDGQPLIGPEEKSVEFSCDIHEHSISTNFDVREMKLGNESDL